MTFQRILMHSKLQEFFTHQQSVSSQITWIFTLFGLGDTADEGTFILYNNGNYLPNNTM